VSCIRLEILLFFWIEPYHNEKRSIKLKHGGFIQLLWWRSQRVPLTCQYTYVRWHGVISQTESTAYSQLAGNLKCGTQKVSSSLHAIIWRLNNSHCDIGGILMRWFWETSKCRTLAWQVLWIDLFQKFKISLWHCFACVGLAIADEPELMKLIDILK